MLSKTLLALLAVGSLAVPAVAKDDEKTTICHRTGGQAIQGLFPGLVIEVAPPALTQHIPGHGDVVLTPQTQQKLARGGKRSICLTDAASNVFNAKGELVQPGPGGGGDEEGPG
ncbi:MAG: hypothetical protein M3M95_06560 [Pseudomonadota bacterium]|nr:hypothetical protein [Pseudomonadota bacterium]